MTIYVELLSNDACLTGALLNFDNASRLSDGLQIDVLGIRIAPIFQLLVSRPTAVDQALIVQGQVVVKGFHVTLARPDQMGLVLGENLALPKPPHILLLSDTVRLVDSGAKQSCYIEVDDLHQNDLRLYVRACEAVFGITLLNEARIFHVTVSNAGQGHPRLSVGEVWGYPSRRI